MAVLPNILGLASSTTNYQPAPVAPEELAQMRRIDKLNLPPTFAGARMLSKILKCDG
jgi:putative transposase